jgi:hypothetical protein
VGHVPVKNYFHLFFTSPLVESLPSTNILVECILPIALHKKSSNGTTGTHNVAIGYAYDKPPHVVLEVIYRGVF